MYQIITDATADINSDMLKGLPELEIIPMEVTIAAQNYYYGPQGNLDIREFYSLLRQGNYASTCQISPFTYTEYFEKYLKQNKDILYLSFSGGMSGTYNNACMVSKELMRSYSNKIICIDTLSASIGLGLLVKYALTKQKEGLSIDETVNWIQGTKQNIAHRFTIDTFDHLKAGGRVSSQSAAIGTLLQVKPLLKIDEQGKLIVVEKPRGHKKALETLLRHLKDEIDYSMPKEIIIGHCDNEEDAIRLQKMIKDNFPGFNTYTCFIDPIIGAHTGAGMLAIAYYSLVR
ncbi:MAG: DegV family protein [Erysipelotrichaceae bacterium]